MPDRSMPIKKRRRRRKYDESKPPPKRYRGNRDMVEGMLLWGARLEGIQADIPSGPSGGTVFEFNMSSQEETFSGPISNSSSDGPTTSPQSNTNTESLPRSSRAVLASCPADYSVAQNNFLTDPLPSVSSPMRNSSSSQQLIETPMSNLYTDLVPSVWQGDLHVDDDVSAVSLDISPGLDQRCLFPGDEDLFASLIQGQMYSSPQVGTLSPSYSALQRSHSGSSDSYESLSMPLLAHGFPATHVNESYSQSSSSSNKDGYDSFLSTPSSGIMTQAVDSYCPPYSPIPSTDLSFLNMAASPSTYGMPLYNTFEQPLYEETNTGLSYHSPSDIGLGLQLFNMPTTQPLHSTPTSHPHAGDSNPVYEAYPAGSVIFSFTPL